MSIPLYNTVSIEDVITNIKLDCSLENTTQFDSYFEIKIKEGLGHLKVLSQTVKKQCKITFNDGTGSLPKDLVRFLALRAICHPITAAELANNPTLAYTNNFFNGGIILYADTTFLSSCGCNINGWNDYRNNVQINNGFIHFNNHLTPDYGIMAYMGLNVDENGNALILERYERALTAYGSWRYKKKFFKQFNQYIIESDRAEWIAQASRIKGEDAATDFQNNKNDIQIAVSALLTSPIVNLFPS